ncbi:glycosyltransferase family 2 protein [candidate division CSSED10-310 bacterium]|uniref:Glycosyltransferase family 2 protein n=1 Tax=candidate division CSSED10-310 bacterium TaxID=2855610 RepID=A0ABV6YRH9_UNCC1
MKVSIIIPAHNELPTLPTILEKVKKLDVNSEIIVVDDGSSDHTADFLQQLKDETIIPLFNDRNMGKGYSIRRALSIVQGDIIAIQDADLEYDPNDLLACLKPFESGAQVVYGSRILNPDNKMSYLRYYLGGRFITFFTNFIFWSHITDEPTCYKLFRKEIIPILDLKCNGFEFCPEITAKLLRLKIPIVEIPISYEPRSFSQGKKINWKDGVKALMILLKYRFFWHKTLK